MRAHLAGLAVVVLSACRGSAAGQRVAPQQHAGRSAADALLLTELDARCGGCHDGSGPIRIDASILADRRLALRAALYVAAGEMPRPSGLPAPERERLVSSLCRVGSVDPDQCIASNLPRNPFSPILEAGAFLRSVDEVAPRSKPRPFAQERFRTQPVTTEDWLWEHDHPPDGRVTRVARLDPTSAVLHAIIALERCDHLPNQADVERCVETILDEERARFPVPADETQPEVKKR